MYRVLLYPPTEAIHCDELHFSIFITMFKGSLQYLSVWTTSFFGGGCAIKVSMSLILSYESVAITAKGASLPVTASGSMDPELLHGFSKQHGLWTSTWFLAAFRITNISPVDGAAWVMDINMPSDNQAMDINLDSGISTDHGHQHDSRCQHRPRTPAWHLSLAWTMEIFQGGLIQKMNHGSSWISSCYTESGWSWGWEAYQRAGPMQAPGCCKLPCWYPGMPVVFASRAASQQDEQQLHAAGHA